MSDVYLNSLGSFIGAIFGVLLGADFRWPLLREVALKPFPSLLLAAWFAYRLYPYVPTIDLHKILTACDQADCRCTDAPAIRPVPLCRYLDGRRLYRSKPLWSATVCADLRARRRGRICREDFRHRQPAEAHRPCGGRTSICPMAGHPVIVVAAGRAGGRARRADPRAAPRTLSIQRGVPRLRLDSVSQPHARIAGSRHHLVPGEILSLWRADLAVGRIRLVAGRRGSFSHAAAAAHQLRGNLFTRAECGNDGRDVGARRGGYLPAAAASLEDPVPQFGKAPGFSSRRSRAIPAPSIPAKARRAPP